MSEKRILILGKGVDMDAFLVSNTDTLGTLDEVITEEEAIERGYYNPTRDVNIKQITPNVCEVFDFQFYDDVAEKYREAKKSEKQKVRHSNKRPGDFKQQNRANINMRARNQGRHRR